MNRKKDKDIEHLLELLGNAPVEDIPPVETRIHRHVPAPRKDNSCGKQCFASVAMVKSAIINRLRKGANTSRLRYYWCSLCSAFHITSSFFKGKRPPP